MILIYKIIYIKIYSNLVNQKLSIYLNIKPNMVMDFRKITGVIFLTFIIFSYVSFRAEWNFFMYIHIIQFFKFIDLPLEYWVFLDRYVFNGAL